MNDETYGDALTALSAAGLIDDDATAEAVRNVIVDPLSGLDPDCADMRPLAADLELMLTQRRDFHALPGKFGFRLSGGCEDVDSQTAADISVFASDNKRCEIHLDGDETNAAIVDMSGAAGALGRLASAFLVLAAQNPAVRRMRDAVAVQGSERIFAFAGLDTVDPGARKAAHAKVPAGVLGPETAPFAVGIGLPFGRIAAGDLLSLCGEAAEARCTEVRSSATRTLVFPVSDALTAATLIACADHLGLITQDTDARLAMDVCPGAPACRNATTATRADAERLLASLTMTGTRTPTIHISGCQKGCARRSAAELTFVGRDGAYDLICSGTVDGSVSVAQIAPRDLATAAKQSIAERAP